MKMALTNSEKQQAFRDRQKAKRLADLKEGNEIAADLSSRAFSKAFENDPNATDFELALGLAGIVAPDFTDDSGPMEHALSHTIDGVDAPFGHAAGSIGRAEVTVGCLIDAAVTLAGIVNNHLKTEITDQLTALEQDDNIERATAMKEAVKLNKMLDRLDKQVRWTFPQWKVTGN
jgi:hypothetical protein